MHFARVNMTTSMIMRLGDYNLLLILCVSDVGDRHVPTGMTYHQVNNFSS